MAKKTSVDLPWHPNFADASLLPDIKPVRSVFFINVVPMAIATILFFWWIFIEWQIGSTNGTISSNEKQIAEHKKENDQLLKDSAEFERWSKSINEIQAFVGLPFKPSQFLRSMAEGRAPQMTLAQVSYVIESRQEAAPKKTDDSSGEKPKPKNFAVYVITISGSVTGSSQQATRNIDSFRDHLEHLDIFKDLKIQSKPLLKLFERDKSLDLYTFTITMEVRI